MQQIDLLTELTSLCRLRYGGGSIEYVRAQWDLSNAYLANHMMQQGVDHLETAAEVRLGLRMGGTEKEIFAHPSLRFHPSSRVTPSLSPSSWCEQFLGQAIQSYRQQGMYSVERECQHLIPRLLLHLGTLQTRMGQVARSRRVLKGAIRDCLRYPEEHQFLFPLYLALGKSCSLMGRHVEAIQVFCKVGRRKLSLLIHAGIEWRGTPPRTPLALTHTHTHTRALTTHIAGDDRRGGFLQVVFQFSW